MGAKVICMASKKGGVGKTTSSLAIGAGLMKRGKKVLFLDLDSQANLSRTMKAEPEPNIYEVLDQESETDILHAVQETDMGDVVAATPKLNAIDTIVKGVGSEYFLREAIAPILPYYDFVIIDCPPSLETITINALTASDDVVIPVQADYYSYDGLRQMRISIERTKKYTNQKLNVAGLLICRFNVRTTISKSVRTDFETLAEKIGTKVFAQPIRECTALKEAQLMHQDIYEYASKSNAVADYEAVLNEMGWN